MTMKKQILCLALPLLLGLAGCSSQEGPSKGSKIENIEEKKAVAEEVVEGVTKNLGLKDFTLEASTRLNGAVTFDEGTLTLNNFGVKATGEFDFPEVLEKGSDISNIKAHLAIETSGSFSLAHGGTTASVDCSYTEKDFEFYFSEGTIYGDAYDTALTSFLKTAFELDFALPMKSKLDLAALVDPDKVIDLQEDFESPDIPEEVLSQMAIYVAEDAFTFELNTAEAVVKDDDGVDHIVKDLYGVNAVASLSIDNAFRFKSFSVAGSVDTSKLDDGKCSGNLDVNFNLNLNYQDSPSVKEVSNKEAYEDFKLF